jgi:hypothetical protein
MGSGFIASVSAEVELYLRVYVYEAIFRYLMNEKPTVPLPDLESLG